MGHCDRNLKDQKAEKCDCRDSACESKVSEGTGTLLGTGRGIVYDILAQKLAAFCRCPKKSNGTKAEKPESVVWPLFAVLL